MAMDMNAGMPPKGGEMVSFPPKVKECSCS